MLIAGWRMAKRPLQSTGCTRSAPSCKPILPHCWNQKKWLPYRNGSARDIDHPSFQTGIRIKRFLCERSKRAGTNPSPFLHVCLTVIVSPLQPHPMSGMVSFGCSFAYREAANRLKFFLQRWNTEFREECSQSTSNGVQCCRRS